MSLLRLASRLAAPALLRLDAEAAHGLTIQALKAMPPIGCGRDDARLQVSAFGLTFPNPVGMAAGFDKQAEVPDALLRLGFGFVETGGVTPLPQPGNPRPRAFRLPQDGAVINRYGLNSEGMEAVRRRLQDRRGQSGIVGINVGPNKEATDRIGDYAALVAAFAPVASYVSLNVSSPNTPGLRDLQQTQALKDILQRALEARAATGTTTPILVKIAPDIALSDLDDIVRVVRDGGGDGMIVSNTTISRPASLLDQQTARETGGLSGKPLFDLSTRMLAETFVRVERAFPLIGVGGIHSPDTALAKIEAGATLIQLYSSLVYQGLGLVEDIKSGLLDRLTREGATSLTPLVGRRVADWRVAG